MDRAQAIAEIRSIFGLYRRARSKDAALLGALTNGKLYELYVLADLISKLNARGFQIRFSGQTLKFKGGPGMIKLSDPHFELWDPRTGILEWRVFVDIEFNTLGFSHVRYADDSRRHELDIIVTKATHGYPDHADIALGVECKSTPNFGKALIKEALGVRRELSYFMNGVQASPLAPSGKTGPDVKAKPPIEFWVAHVDPSASRYKESPSAFGIELVYLEP